MSYSANEDEWRVRHNQHELVLIGGNRCRHSSERTSASGVQLRDELRNIIALGDDLGEYHQQVRELFSLVAQPFEVIRKFEAEQWRTPESTN
ncbi:hypothetical protein ACFU44_16130 [Nocardia rhizosphaerihabitans]|uniref:hypothetical protein n=1 Tax=Nocardia rhizosphaerihabitans TaxID=1691570 RepID=UPI00366D4551